VIWYKFTDIMKGHTRHHLQVRWNMETADCPEGW